ncbi:LptF/LptG family permease [Limnoglobus roseus]|uniref:YjgP/YjgQ family permease n=1 Tax=Limnoglobus roseus TaxID=2598579 RepID=A0A5C1AE51_9BACT|nr:LptF/LptG family permease [Limnoglobus roseus]QEL15358.1 YjgP/YjgQ family permease [Limnoglobus roseus]
MFLLGGILHRVIFWELVKVFALTLTGLTGLFLIGLVIQQANQLGLSMLQTLQAIPLLVPYTLPYTIPATTLFASCVVYGRIAHDNEAVAMKAAGVNLHTILRPAFILGLIASAATFALAHSVIPHTQTELQRRLLRNPEELLYNLLKRDRTFKATNFPYVIHVRDVVGQRLMDVVVKRKKMQKDGNGKDVDTGDYDFVVRAREAKLRVVLPDAEHPNEQPMLFIDPDRWRGGDGVTEITTDANRPMGVPLPDVFSQKDVKNRPMNLIWDELPEKANEYREIVAGLEDKRREAEQLASQSTDVNIRTHWLKTVEGLTYYINEQLRQMRNTENEYYMRPALSLGCLVFAILGCPVGIRANRADYLSSFVTCFLPTVAVYYPLLLAGSNMGRDGKVPLPIGVFAADAIVSAAAVVLILKLIRR